MPKVWKNKKVKANKPEATQDRDRGVYKQREFEDYAFFMALDRKDRKEAFGFDTDAAFAKDRGLHPGTLTDWKYNEKLWELRDKHLIHFKKYTANIIGKLAARAERTGEAFHTLTYMKLVEGYSEKSGLDITSKGKKVAGFKVIVHHANTDTNKKPNSGSGK